MQWQRATESWHEKQDRKPDAPGRRNLHVLWKLPTSPLVPPDGCAGLSLCRRLYLSEKATCIHPQCFQPGALQLHLLPVNDPNAGFQRSRMSEDSVPRFHAVRDLDKAQTDLVCFCFPREDVNKLEVQEDSINPSQYSGGVLPSGPSPADSKTWAASWDTTVMAPTTGSWWTSPLGVPSGMMTKPCFCGKEETHHHKKRPPGKENMAVRRQHMSATGTPGQH